MTTNVRISDETHSRLKEVKPYDSLSFDELFCDMLAQYDPPAVSENKEVATE